MTELLKTFEFPEACVGSCPQIGRWLSTVEHSDPESWRYIEAVSKLKGLSDIACATQCGGPWDDQTEMAPVLYCSGNPGSDYGV